VCRQTIRVTHLELRPNRSGRVKCLGTIRGAYLHRGSSEQLIRALEYSLETGAMIDVEQVRGAITRAYFGAGPPLKPKRREAGEKPQFWELGGYAWKCLRCGWKTYSTQPPTECPKCR